MKIRRYILILLSIFMIALLQPIWAFATEDIDLERSADLTISYRDSKNALVGVQFDIYRIAAVDKNGSLTVVEPFDRYNLSISATNDSSWKTLASTLEGYVLRDRIVPTDYGVTDAEGVLKFPKQADTLQHGLYLVMGHQHVQNGYIYETQPVVIQIPGLNSEANEWIYSVTLNTKADAKPESDHSITRKVLKVWEDDGYEAARPEAVEIDLLRDGEVYDTVTLNVENYWRHTWTQLDADHHWAVVEKELDNYTVEIMREGITFVVTNTYDVPDTPPPTTPPTTPPDEPDEPELPQTGQIWWLVPVLIAAGLMLIVIGLIRRRGVYHEE